MKWKTVLNNWESGFYFHEDCPNRFLWNTSVLKNNANSIFKQKIKTCRDLPTSQDCIAFNRHIKNSRDKYVTSFPNISGDALLVVPMPRLNKNFATLKDFMENASDLQQRNFWKHVAYCAKQRMKTRSHIWISTSGLGVPYLHVRISDTPKYYFDRELSTR